MADILKIIDVLRDMI